MASTIVKSAKETPTRVVTVEKGEEYDPTIVALAKKIIRKKHNKSKKSIKV